MGYLILALIVIIFMFLVAHRLNKRKSKKRIEQIRSAWGKPKEGSFQFDWIRKYADTIKGRAFHRLTDQTIDDIDFYRLFAFIDRTTSRVGQQFLFKKVTEPTNSVEDPTERLISLFTENKELREEVQLELLKLSGNEGLYISSLLKDDLLKRPKWFGLLAIDLIIVVCLVILSLKYSVFIIVLIIPMTFNMILHYWNKSNTYRFSGSFAQLNVLMGVSRSLLKKGDFLYGMPVEESLSNLKLFQHKTRLLYVDSGKAVHSELGIIANYLLELVKALFLIEVFTIYNIIKELENKKSSIETLFRYVGNIDASISIASLRAGTVKTCRPVLTSGKKEMEIKGIYHPLIENCVKNDLSVRGKSILITGSNMSGKSTFLRTMAINSILAQTIFTCFADEYNAPVVKQFSSIRIDDNIFQGKSYYFEEVNIMASLLAAAETSHQNLFVLDEVFKGTNTVERVAAAKAVLTFLNRNDNIVIVSTHDIELADMLDREYDLFHFIETIENNELHFDHIIRAGQLRTGNAIRILELANYPAEIIEEARQISMTLRLGKVKGTQ